MDHRPIADIEAEIIEDFSVVDDWMDRYEILIDIGNELSPFPEEHRLEENLVRGCQSRVWLVAEMRDNLVHFQADSDSSITKGLISLLVKVLSDHSPQEILSAELDFIDRIGVRQHLSPNRSNGLSAMLKQMKLYALAFGSKK
ncbi:MAG: SufE family protein [Bacteroidota bacterium]